MLANNQISSELVDEFVRGNGTLFVGAGLSIGAGFPSWAKLVEPLSSGLAQLPPGLSLPDIAQRFENQYGRRVLVDKIRGELEQYRGEPTKVHRALMKLPVTRYFTTNFDFLLEDTFRSIKRPFNRMVNTDDISFFDSSRTTLVKLHGDLSLPTSLVFTSFDYEEYFDQHPAIGDLLKVELQTRTVLFVGYSFSDHDLRMILRRISREVREMRRNVFTVLIDPAPGDTAALESRGVRVVALQTTSTTNATDALTSWLEELTSLVSPPASQGSQPVTAGSRSTPAIRISNDNLPSRFGELLGRKEDLSRVMEGLRSRFPLITIQGFAGIGKTSLAVEIGHSCAPNRDDRPAGALPFDYVVWVSAKDKPDQKRWLNDVLNAVANTTQFAAIAQFPAEKSDQKLFEVDRILRAFKVLVIIDNYETIDDPELKRWIESIPEPSKIIVTSRDNQLQQKAWAVTLKGLEATEALILIKQHASNVGLDFITREPDESLLSLVEVTSGNPQAIKLALGLVQEGAIDLRGLTNQLFESNVDRTMGRLFEELFFQSWNKLSEHAQRILLAAPLFVGVSSIQREALQAASSLGGFEFEKGLAVCVRFGLLDIDHSDKRLVIHPLTRAFARLRLAERPDIEREAHERCANYYLDFLRKTIIRQEPSIRYWNALVSDRMADVDAEWPSLQAMMKWAQQEGQDNLLLAFVMMLVHFMDSRFYNSERLDYVKAAIESARRLGRKEDEALLRIDALGWTYVEENRLEEAYEEIAGGYRIAEAFSPRESIDLKPLGLAWRARVRIEQGRAQEARELIEEALRIHCKPWIRTRVHMAAGDIALKSGEREAALNYYQSAEAEARTYGDEGHSYQIAPRIGLAFVSLGRLSEAERKFTELSGSWQVAIGKLYAEFGLAKIAYERGDASAARVLVQDIKARLSRRTTSNLLLNMINELFEDLERRQTSELHSSIARGA